MKADQVYIQRKLPPFAHQQCIGGPADQPCKETVICTRQVVLFLLIARNDSQLIGLLLTLYCLSPVEVIKYPQFLRVMA